jgi:hypothetical protein
VFEQGGPFKKVPVVDLSSSSNEKGLIPDISLDEEFTKKLFGDLNHDVHGPPGDDKIIILNDFDEEEEAREEDATDAEATPTSAARTPISTADVDEALKGMQDDNSDDLAPIKRWAMATTVETRPTRLRLPRQSAPARRRALRRTSRVLHCYSISSFVERSGDGDAESLKYFDAIHASCSFSISVCP